MFEKKKYFFRWLVSVLFVMIFTAAAGGCTPKIPANMMSVEDMQTCDDSAAMIQNDYGYKHGSAHAQDFLVKPAPAEITSPLSGVIVPYTTNVEIKFEQPPADAQVTYRHHRVLAFTIDGKLLERVGYQYSVTPSTTIHFHEFWTPPGPGKYLIAVLFRNLETVDALNGNIVEMGKQLELEISSMESFTINHGPYSFAYACVQIDVPTAVDSNNPQIGTVGVQPNITMQVPTKTNTFTPFPTHTKTVTLIPSSTNTPTFIPSFTPTYLKPSYTPTAKKETNTSEPPTDTPVPAANCPGYTTQRDCEAVNECHWVTSPTNPGSCENR